MRFTTILLSLFALVVGTGMVYFVVSSSSAQTPAVAGFISRNVSSILSSTTTRGGAATSTLAANPQDPCQGLPRSSVTTTTRITGGPIISFDFDDGFLSSYQHALPIINGAGFPTTQYIITGDLTKPGRVNAQQVLQMQAAGNEIGAHTRTHPYLTRISTAQATDEICGSRRDLLALGITATTFAYPEGDFDPSVEAIAKQAGFAGARTTKAGLNNDTTDTFLLRSYQMSASTTLPQIEYMINQAIANKEWLTIVFHRTDEAGNPVSVSSPLIAHMVAYIQSTKVPVVTESQGLSILNTIHNTVNFLRLYTPAPVSTKH